MMVGSEGISVVLRLFQAVLTFEYSLRLGANNAACSVLSSNTCTCRYTLSVPFRLFGSCVMHPVVPGPPRVT